MHLADFHQYILSEAHRRDLSKVRVIPFLPPRASMLFEKPDMHIDEERMMRNHKRVR